MNTKECPCGDKEVDYVDTGNNKYVFCYICQTKYYEEDYNEMSKL